MKQPATEPTQERATNLNAQRNPEKSVLTNETEPVTEPTQERAANSNAQMINPEVSPNERNRTRYRTHPGTSCQLECSNDKSKEVSFDE